MRVKMISMMSGPEINVQPGQEVDVPEETAEQLINGGFAVLVKNAAIETTELPLDRAEKAVITHGRNKGRGR